MAEIRILLHIQFTIDIFDYWDQLYASVFLGFSRIDRVTGV